MHLQNRGTFQAISHESDAFLILSVEGSHLFTLYHVSDLTENGDSVLSPLGNFNTMSKVRAAITKHVDNKENK